MYGRYAYKACTAAQLRADLAAFIGGASFASLPFCDAANSYVEGGAPSVWTCVKASSGVIKSPITGGGAGDKLFMIDSAGGSLVARSIESWNSTTSLPLNPTAVSEYSVACNVTMGGAFFFCVTPDAVALWTVGSMGFLLLTEVGRDTPVMTNRPVGIVIGDQGYWALPRVKNPTAVGDTKPLTGLSMRGYVSGNASMLGDGEVPFYQVTDFWVWAGDSLLLGKVPKICMGPKVGTTGDVMIVNGLPYIMLHFADEYVYACLLIERA